METDSLLEKNVNLYVMRNSHGSLKMSGIIVVFIEKHIIIALFLALLAHALTLCPCGIMRTILMSVSNSHMEDVEEMIIALSLGKIVKIAVLKSPRTSFTLTLQVRYFCTKINNFSGL